MELKLGVKVDKVAADRVVLSDGSEIMTRTVVWAGGIQASAVAANAGVPHGRFNWHGAITSMVTGPARIYRIQ